MTTAFIPLGLAFIMFAVGVGLAVRDFRDLARRPTIVVAGVVAQTVALPLLALVVATIFALPPVAALGLIMVATVSGGVTSNFLTVLARGDAALSVVMTATSTAVGVVTIPLILTAALSHLEPTGVGLPESLALLDTAGAILVVTALPMGLGMIVRAAAPDAARRLLGPVRRVAAVLFAAIVVAAFSRDWHVIEAHWQTVGLPVIIFNLAAVGLGLVVAWLLGAGARTGLTLAIECGLQNVALALFLGGVVLDETALMVPAVIYALVMNVTALGLLAVGRRLEISAFLRGVRA